MRSRPVSARLVITPIRAYQRYVSPLRMPACRFIPSCSQYAIDAVSVHGVPRGTWLALRRLARCHPYHRGGHDPVPPRRTRPVHHDRAVVATPPASRPVVASTAPAARAIARDTGLGDPRC